MPAKSPLQNSVRPTGGANAPTLSVEIDGEEIAVEVDGPSHFNGRRTTGTKVEAKTDQELGERGVCGSAVLYFEWDENSALLKCGGVDLAGASVIIIPKNLVKYQCTLA